MSCSSPRGQNGCHFADDIFRCIFLNENVWILLKISMKVAPKVRINDIPTRVQILAWRRPHYYAETFMYRSSHWRWFHLEALELASTKYSDTYSFDDQTVDVTRHHLSSICSYLHSKCHQISRDFVCPWLITKQSLTHWDGFFLNENVWILINISLKFVPRGRINNILALVQIMAWRRPGDKPLSEPMIVKLLTPICVTRPQCINKGLMWMDKFYIYETVIWMVSGKHTLIVQE